MVRGTIPLSPWGDPAHIRIFGEQGAPFAIGVYIIFYSGAFTIPFILIEAEADHRLEPYRSDNRLNVRCRIRVGAFLIATACVLTLPFSLPVVVACARAIIVTTAYWEEDWNAWLLAVWVIFSFLLALTGVRTLQAASYDADRNRDRG
jgi:asparagine N-glycosylation enzyme membrane subunit Stt3